MTSGMWRATGKCVRSLRGSEVAGAWEVYTRRRLIPGVKGFASSNLRYMAKFYSLYTPLIFPQVVGN